MLEKYTDKFIKFTSYHENLKEQKRIMKEAENNIKKLKEDFLRKIKKGKLNGWWIKFRDRQSEYLYYAKVKKSIIKESYYLDIESDKYILVFNDEINIKTGDFIFDYINPDEIEIIDSKNIHSIIENCSKEVLKE